MSIAVDYDNDNDGDGDGVAAGGMFRSFEYYKITNYVSFDTLPPPYTLALAVGPPRSTRAFANKYADGRDVATCRRVLLFSVSAYH